MTNHTLEKMASHLEFLGYTVKMKNPMEPGNPSFVAKHNQHPNFIFWEMEPGITVIRSSFNITNSSSPELKQLAINEMSGLVNVVNPYFEQKDGKIGLWFDACYTGEYSKELFAKFISILQKDLEQIYRIPSMMKAFMDE